MHQRCFGQSTRSRGECYYYDHPNRRLSPESLLPGGNCDYDTPSVAQSLDFGSSDTGRHDVALGLRLCDNVNHSAVQDTETNVQVRQHTRGVVANLPGQEANITSTTIQTGSISSTVTFLEDTAVAA